MTSSFDINFKKNILFDDFSEEKPDPISKKKIKTFKELKNIAMNQIHKRYGSRAKIKYKYLGLIMENLIFNKNTHLVSTFKDYMIWDYVEEFLKRYYKDIESEERVPKFASFYKNYLKFFCIPTFKDLYCNDMIHNFSEKKAELFYNENYRNKKEKISFQEDYGLLEESESDDENSESRTSKSNMNIEKTIFNETVKKKIERYSPINTSMALPESDTKLKPDDSGLLITSSNETSLVNIMNGMISLSTEAKKKKLEQQKNDKNKNSKNRNNLKNNANNNSNNNNHQGESSSSYRMNQKNLISSTLNKFNTKTLETLLNSQMKNKNKNLLHYSDYSKLIQKNQKIHSKHNNHTNSNNVLLKNNPYNNNGKNSKNKIMSYIGIYKKKSIPKSRNENKSPEEIIKSQAQINNFIKGNMDSNKNKNINNLKGNNMNININQLGNNNNLSNRAKNITSINNYNLNYKQSIQKSRNQQQSTSINSNTYSKYSFDKINNVKKKINPNLIKNNNIEYILNQLKIHPFCTLKKSSTRKTIQSNSNRNNKKEDKKSTKKANVLSTNNFSRNEFEINSAKIRTINNKSQNNHGISPNSHKRKFESSLSAFDFLKKTSEYIRNMHTKSSHSKDVKVYKKSTRNCSYNEKQKSYADEKNNNLNSKTNNKISFDAFMNNNIKKNNHKNSNILNNNNTKHIHNVNININNQINIGGKQFHELFSFSELVKKNCNNNANNNIKNIFTLTRKEKKSNLISRNKNQSLDFNAYTNNQTNNANSIGSNKMNSISDIQNGNNNIYKTQYKINSRFSGNIKNKNKNNNNKKIRLTNNALFRSMKIINNNDNIKEKK